MSPSRPQIRYIELPAGHLDETKGFYTAVFGWHWVDYGPTYSAYNGDGLDVGLNTLAAPGPEHQVDEENAIGPLILFETDDLEAVQSGVCAAGGSIVSSIYNYPGGRRFHFRDPSGNILGVYRSDAAD